MTPPVFDPVDVSRLDFWSRSPEERDVAFAELRRRAPVSWQRPIESQLAEPDIPGFWAVVSHEHVREVSHNPEVFCSSQGIQMEDVPTEILQAASSFLAMDGEEHRANRRLVSGAFTPKQVKKIEQGIAARAVEIAERLKGMGETDFVENVSKQMPMNTFYDIAGLPQEYRDAAAHNADEMAAWNDPEVAAGRSPAAVLNDGLVGNLSIGMDFSEMTRACPRDDVWSNLVAAEIDGRKLDDEELASMFVLLSFAGNDTTRSTLTYGTKTLLEHPEQLAHLMEDFDGRIEAAVDEVLRWVSPILSFRRTATRDTELGGQHIREGDWVVMFYLSANRDEKVFEDPWRFDITRSPNPHFAFGGGGPHFCIGSFLARMMIKHTFREVFTRVPDLKAGEAVPLVGNFARAFKRMPVSTGCPVTGSVR